MDITVDGLAWVPLAQMSEGQAAWLRRKLTIADAHGRRASLLNCYVEDNDRGVLGIPRGFFHQGARREHNIRLSVSSGMKWPDGELLLSSSLDGNAQLGFKAALAHLGSNDVADGFVLFATRDEAWKASRALIRSMRVRTLVLVADELSVANWNEALEPLSGLKVSDDEDSHVSIRSVKSVLVGEGSLSSFGFVISADLGDVDPKEWASAISRIPAAKRLGVVVGHIRDPLARKVVSYHLGGPLFTSTRQLLEPKVRRVWSAWKLGGSSRVNPLFISRDVAIGAMVNSAIYNRHVVEQIVLALKADRKILVFSENVSHLRTLYRELESSWVGEILIDYLLDGMGRLDIADALRARVVFTLYSMLGNLPEMAEVDTVVLATPIRNPIEAIRCALIPLPGKKDPVVVDMRCDGIPVCKEYGAARDGLYERAYGG